MTTMICLLIVLASFCAWCLGTLKTLNVTGGWSKCKANLYAKWDGFLVWVWGFSSTMAKMCPRQPRWILDHMVKVCPRPRPRSSLGRDRGKSLASWPLSCLLLSLFRISYQLEHFWVFIDCLTLICWVSDIQQFTCLMIVMTCRMMLTCNK